MAQVEELGSEQPKGPTQKDELYMCCKYSSGSPYIELFEHKINVVE